MGQLPLGRRQKKRNWSVFSRVRNGVAAATTRGANHCGVCKKWFVGYVGIRIDAFELAPVYFGCGAHDLGMSENRRSTAN